MSSAVTGKRKIDISEYKRAMTADAIGMENFLAGIWWWEADYFPYRMGYAASICSAVYDHFKTCAVFAMGECAVYGGAIGSVG